MDKEAIKRLLEAYRPQDAEDPIFAEALKAVAADPELAAWFADMQRFDAVMSAKFQEAEVPTDVKDHILRGYHSASPVLLPSVRRVWTVPASIAAVLLFGLVVWHFAAPPSSAIAPLELQAIQYTDHMPALQFVCFRPEAVAKWVNDQPASQKVGLKLPVPDATMSMVMIGASTATWNGRPVVMICLQDGKRMAMLYVLNASDVPEMRDGATETFQHADWVVRATKSNGQVHLLTAKGRPG